MDDLVLLASHVPAARTPPRMRRIVALCAILTVIAACGSIGARPYFTPLPDAVVDTVPAEAAIVIGRLQTLVVGEGLAVRTSSPAEGYLETEWYDVDRRGPVGGSLDPRRIVRLRFFADMTGANSTVLSSEAVTLRAIDPSIPERQNEAMVPPGHPGNQILERILIALRSDRPTGQ
jgi:hypothetical protein